MPRKTTVKTLTGQYDENLADARTQYESAQTQEQQAEDLRASLYAGLGSAEQLSGAYGDAQAPRDLSQYSRALRISSPYGGTAESLGKLGRMGENRKGLKRGPAGQLLGQVREVNDLYKQSYEAAKAGDFETADRLRAQAEGLTDQYSLNEGFSSKSFRDWRFGMEDVFAPLADQEGQAAQALGSETGMLVGGLVHGARQLQDPFSEESTRFRDSLTSGAVAAVDQSRERALRALASDERGAARSMRDAQLAAGSASSSVRTAAVAARASERFATIQADIEGDVAAAKAQIFSAAGQMYEQFRVDLANNATSLASAWVNDQSGVRDAFRQLQTNINLNYAGALSSIANNALTQATSLRMLQKQLDAADTTWVDDTLGFVGGVLGAYLGGGGGGGDE